MPYVPVNTAAYVASYAGAIAGMAVSGWITDPDSADYLDVTVIAGAFAKSFDIAWNNAAQLNDLELACMTSVVQEDFRGRGPGPFASTLFKDYTNWNIAARACVALILECDIFIAGEGITPGAGVPNTSVNRVLFVDAGNFPIPGTLANGSIALPYENIGNALLRVVAEGWNSVILQVAPGTYSDDINVPGISLVDLYINGWATLNPNFMAQDLPDIDGTITVAADMNVHFNNVFLSGPMIQSTNPANVDLSLSFSHCLVTNQIQGDEVFLELDHTELLDNVTGTTDVALNTDGYSWSNIVRQEIVITPATYARNFRDTGADTNTHSLTENGIAIGTAADVTWSYPGARPGEFAIISLDSPAVDFFVTFHYTDTDEVHFMLYNLSRVSTDFNESASVCVLHSDMAALPIP